MWAIRPQWMVRNLESQGLNLWIELSVKITQQSQNINPNIIFHFIRALGKYIYYFRDCSITKFKITPSEKSYISWLVLGHNSKFIL